MPLYSYVCTQCGHETDLIRHVEHRDYTEVCPKCGHSMEHVWAAPATPVLNPPNPVVPRRGGGGYR